jgi:thiamine pyrophosphokinase
MSSHHIVRDEQEPALFIMDPSACPTEVTGQLLEWSPIVATTSSALPSVLETGIKVDLVLHTAADNTETLYHQLTDQQPVRLMETDPLFPAHNLLVYLLAKGQPALNIVSNLPPERLFPEGTAMQGIAIFCGSFRGVFQPSGKFEKWAGAGQYFKAAPNGTTYILNNLQTSEKEKGLLEAQQDGFVRIESSSAFWLWEKIA